MATQIFFCITLVERPKKYLNLNRQLVWENLLVAHNLPKFILLQ